MKTLASQIYSINFLHALFIVTLFFLSQTHITVVQSDDQLIENACNKFVFSDLCIASLKSDPRSAEADLKGLTLIMFDVVGAKAKLTLDEINRLLPERPELTTPLNLCASYHKHIVEADVSGAAEALERGDKEYAAGRMYDAGFNAQDLCEKSFSGYGASPLTSFNNAVEQTSAIATNFARYL